jgi:hypothetical protein
MTSRPNRHLQPKRTFGETAVAVRSRRPAGPLTSAAPDWAGGGDSEGNVSGLATAPTCWQ